VASVSSVGSLVSRPVKSRFPARGKRSFVNTVCAEIMQKSSTVTAAQM
jgi:hypothetical protein